MNEGQVKIGINGLGRIGKLTVWHHVGRRYFNEIVVNIGRIAGTGLADIANNLKRDDTYGHCYPFLYCHEVNPVILDIDSDSITISLSINAHNMDFGRSEKEKNTTSRKNKDALEADMEKLKYQTTTSIKWLKWAFGSLFALNLLSLSILFSRLVR